MQVVKSPYFDPRFVARKVNNSRLTTQINKIVAKIVADRED